MLISGKQYSFTYRVQSSATRTDSLFGVSFLVCPVISNYGNSIVWPVNAPGACFIPAQTLRDLAVMRNGRPVVMDHPMVDGEYVDSIHSKEVMENYIFGIWMNNTYDEEQQCIRGELWINESRAKVVEGAKDVVKRIRAQEIVEVSERNLVAIDPTPGEYEGQKYVEVLTLMIPEHIATLPNGVIGACSNGVHGCGAGAINQTNHNNQATQQTNQTIIENGVNQSSGGSRIKEVSMTIGSIVARMFRRQEQAKKEEAREIEARNEELMFNLFERIADALREVVPGSYIVDFDPDEKYVVYDVEMLFGGYGGKYVTKMYKRSYTEENNKVTLLDDAQEVIKNKEYIVVGEGSSTPSQSTEIEPVNQEEETESQEVKEVVMADCGCKKSEENESQTAVVESPPNESAAVVTPVMQAQVAQAQSSSTPVVPVDEWIKTVPDEFRSLLQSHAQQEREEKSALLNAAKELGVEGLDALALPVLRATCERMGIRTAVAKHNYFGGGPVPVVQAKEYTKPKVWGA